MSTVTFTAGQTIAVRPVDVLEDDTAESAELFHAELSNPSVGVVLGVERRATAEILNNEGTYAGS